MPFIKTCFMVLFSLCLFGCGGSEKRHYQGYIEGENTFLASPIGGKLVKKRVDRGQWVKRGELLFQLDANPEAFVIQQSDAELLQAKKRYKDLENPRRKPEIEAIEEQIAQVDADLKLAALRVNRTKQLYKKQAIDKDSVDEAEVYYELKKHLKAQYEANLALALQGARDEQMNAQQAQITSLIAKLNQAKWQLAQKSIYAPDDGVIFDTYFELGEYVPNQQAVASLLTPAHIRVEFFVPASALSELHVGQWITFTCDGCARSNQAVIHYISPEAEYIPPLVYSDENRDKLVFRVKATPSNARQFKPGQPVVITEL